MRSVRLAYSHVGAEANNKASAAFAVNLTENSADAHASGLNLAIG
jgi:hypothetical protein